MRIGLAAIVVIAISALSAWLILRPTDEDAWRLASTANTQEAYELYVSEWSAGAFVGNAKDRIAVFEDERAWRKAVEQNTAEGYLIYGLDKSGKYVKQARERQAVLVEALDWEWALNKGTHEAFLEYARKWPNGANIAEAKSQLHDFQLRAEYREATALDTITALQSFILSHPDAPDAVAAGERVEALKRDEEPFLAARKLGTQEAFEKFLRDYPDHVRTTDAERELKDLKGIDIFRLVAEKRVSISIKGGGLTHARVTLTNTGDRAVTVFIPSAVMFASRNPRIQNMVTTAGMLVTLRPKETKSLGVPVACANLPRRAPGSSNELFLESIGNRPALISLVRQMQKENTRFVLRQAAVWILTDNATFRGLFTLTTMRSAHVVRALRLLERAGIDVTKYRIWREAGTVLEKLMLNSKHDRKRYGDHDGEPNAIWLVTRLDATESGSATYRARSRAMHIAGDAGWTEMVRLLVKKGHDVNARDVLEETPLYGLARSATFQPPFGFEVTVKELIAAGADINAVNQDGRTPIFYAGTGKAFDVLSAAGAKLDIIDRKGMTLMHVVSFTIRNDVGVLDVLTSAGLDINKADNLGNTPLHQALRHGDRIKIRELMRRGAVVSPNGKGKLPIDLLPTLFERQEFEKLLSGQ